MNILLGKRLSEPESINELINFVVKEGTRVFYDPKHVIRVEINENGKELEKKEKIEAKIDELAKNEGI